MTDATQNSRTPRAAWGASRLRWWMGGAAALVICGAARLWMGPLDASAEPAPSAAPSRTPPANRAPAAAPANPGGPPAAAAPGAAQKPDVVAIVNGASISRNDLGKECLKQFGTEVLESLVNKRLIAEHCAKLKIQVTRQEVDQEIDRMAQRFGLPKDQWMKLLKDERHISPEQYARDIIWPAVALRKLAAERLTVSSQEIQEAYETQFGPAVQARLIACNDLEKARQVHAKATANPDDFGNLAKQFSDDANSASSKGLIQPIRMHLGDKKIEQVAFHMQPNEVSEIIAVGNQYVILKCETRIPERKVPMDQVEKTLTEAIRDKKLRLVADNVFTDLQKETHVENVFNDENKRRSNPGVAALINGQPITIRELAEECIDRHGIEVLEGMISRRLLEQACTAKNVEVTQQELQAEVARAARAMGKTQPNGEPDVNAWLQEVTGEQGVTLDRYMQDAVWPSVALKKLVGGKVEVSEGDLRKGFEANYGPRVRCRAIVFNQLRRAQEVWEMARQRPTAEFFGDLAEQYSVEASSRSLRGEVPPIQKHGGQPLLEQEAFSLSPGELSGVVQVGDKFVILHCEGMTEPTRVDFAEVKDLIYEDIHEKKLRLAMAQEFGRLEKTAQVDNYLAGTVQPGENPEVVQPVSGQQQLQRSGSVQRAAAAPSLKKPARK